MGVAEWEVEGIGGTKKLKKQQRKLFSAVAQG